MLDPEVLPPALLEAAPPEEPEPPDELEPPDEPEPPEDEPPEPEPEPPEDPEPPDEPEPVPLAMPPVPTDDEPETAPPPSGLPAARQTRIAAASTTIATATRVMVRCETGVSLRRRVAMEIYSPLSDRGHVRECALCRE